MSKNLRIIENELVPVYETSNGEKVVYGTELYAVLEAKSKFADWIKNRLKDCDALENEDFQSFSKILEKGGRPQTEYIIKLDTAKEMAMLERNEKGKRVRRYFIQIEKKYKENVLGGALKEMADNPMKLLEIHYEALKQNRAEIAGVKQDVSAVEQRVGKLESNMTVTHEQIQVIKNRVNKKITALLGGYGSNAYKDRHLRGKAYSRFNKDYCDYFRINARANTLAAKFDEALGCIDMWEPDTNLRIQIKDCNVQMKIDVA